MNEATLKEETEEFAQYADLLSSFQQLSPDRVCFVTLEGTKYWATLSRAGWTAAEDPHVDNSSISHPGAPHEQQHYETVEALLMTLSPLFLSKWSELLARKLWEHAEDSQVDFEPDADD